MQRTRAELEAMTHDDLVQRVLELQDLLREGLAVRGALHAVLNALLAAKEGEVGRFAEADVDALNAEEQELKRAWDAARLAVANPLGAARRHQRG